MITFKKISYKNFLSTGNTPTVINLDKASSTLIIGENGAGKSTILDALCFVLFGKAFRNINKPTLVNSVNEKGLEVILDFNTNNREYRVVRGIKPNKFEIYSNGELIDQKSSSRDYQSFLEQTILKMNFKSFTQIVILGSTSFTPFMQLTAADRRSVIEDLLDIQIFSVMNVVAKQQMADNLSNSDRLRTEIANYKRAEKLILDTLSDMEVDTQRRIDEVNSRKSKLLHQVSEITEKKETDRRNLTEIVDSLLDDPELEKRRISLVSFKSKIEGNQTRAAKELSFYDENDICPTCDQNIDEDFKHAKVHALQERLDEYEKGLGRLHSEIDQVNEKLTDIKEKQSSIRELQTDMKHADKDIKRIQHEVDALEQEIKKLSDSAHNTLISAQQEKLKIVRVDKDRAAESLESLLNDADYIETILGMLKDGGIKTRIIRQYLPIMNKHINKYLSDMNFFINFTIDENFEETIKSRYRDMFSYENFSEGEKMRIDLALLFTWRIVAKMKNSVSTNLLILDEVFDSSLDMNGTDEFLKIMKSLGTDTNVFVISHKGDQLMDKFSEVLRFKKVKGFSQLQED